VVSAAFGVLAGVGGYTFVYAKGSSYLGSDPRACANCHVMNEQYAGWTRSSHHAVAGCNDCHAPHDFVGKWSTKAINGFNHSFAFTSGRFPEPIRIGGRNREITQGACRSCHAEIVAAIDHGPARIDCLSCHASVGHLH
jgi:cytochrome c nitrite reductase small subunit